MKKIYALILALCLLSMTACSNENSEPDKQSGSTQSTVSEAADANNGNAAETKESTNSSEAPSRSPKILIAYFSVPEDETDTVAGASVVIKNGQKTGSTEYVAKLVQQTIGGDLFEIKAAESYPTDHGILIDQAADEKADNIRPELETSVENFEDYDIVIIGYPNWWADLPVPVYTFLEQYDFGGKTVVPFVTHGGSGFSATVGTITEMLPNSTVSDNTLSLSRNNVADCEDTVEKWAKSLV